MYCIEARDVSLIQRLHIDIWQYVLPCLRCNAAAWLYKFCAFTNTSPLDKGPGVLPLYI